MAQTNPTCGYRIVHVRNRQQADVECLNCGAHECVDRDEDGGAAMEQRACGQPECPVLLCAECPQWQCDACGLPHCPEHRIDHAGLAVCPACLSAIMAEEVLCG